MLSMPYIDVVVQVDRQTGELKGQWGSVEGSWAFDPPTSGFEFQHFPVILENGNLLISTHSPDDVDTAIPGNHRFIEFDMDESAQVLRQKWIFGEGVDDWPKYKGMAFRLENGNTLVNYGTSGTVLEVTRSKEIVWRLFWDTDFEAVHLNKMLGHNTLIDDLYPLCDGPQ
jgi:hypothetical protein